MWTEEERERGTYFIRSAPVAVPLVAPPEASGSLAGEPPKREAMLPLDPEDELGCIKEFMRLLMLPPPPLPNRLLMGSLAVLPPVPNMELMGLLPPPNMELMGLLPLPNMELMGLVPPVPNMGLLPPPPNMELPDVPPSLAKGL